MTKRYLKLLESEIEKAEITLAVRELSDRLQKMASDLSRTIVDDIPSVTERIKAIHGIQAGNDFGKKLSDDLNSLVQQILDTKSSIDDRSLVLSGDATEADTDVPNDMDFDTGEELPDMAVEPEIDDTLDLPGAGKVKGPLDDDSGPLGRKVKTESAQLKKVKKLIEKSSPKNKKILTEMYKRGGQDRLKVIKLANKV